MKPTKILFAIAFMLFTATVTQAQTRVSDRAKIANGVRNGELTGRETRNLARQQRDIRQDTRAAKSDGVITPQERRHIKVEKRRADANIYCKKHNNRSRN